MALTLRGPENPPVNSRRPALIARYASRSLPGFYLDKAVDGFATEAPVGADLESRQRALSEQAINGRAAQSHWGMQLQEVGEFADSHNVALLRLF